MLGQSHQTVITRQLAAWVANLAVHSATAGIYSTNSEVMPELNLRYGYYLILKSIIVALTILY